MNAPDLPTVAPGDVVETPTVVEAHEDPVVAYVATNTFQRRLLLALNFSSRHIYAGTVPEQVIAKRRARNKAARRSRRINRLAA